ncbi:MAG TPA: ATP-binding protein [Chlamydiales bacterium]|nr:ATP-binding protein [Chlamydiales bacterium]
MYKRLLEAPLRFKSSFFLFGPRGTGKTSWIKAQFPNAIIFDLLSMNTYVEFLQNPSVLEEKIPKGFDDWIVIDEIQRIPDLLNEVHRLIESRRYRFILTGSSARTLRRKGVNLLAGRAHSYKMFPLTAAELGSDFQLSDSLSIGHLPAVYNDKKAAEEYLSSYIGTYLREEVLQEGLTRNLTAFARFLEIASFSQGSVLNISEVARECKIERKIVENYFVILEDLLIATRLPVFTKKAQRQTVAHPKFYYFDVGVYRSLCPKGPLDTPELIGGTALETLVYQELSAVNDYERLNFELYFWRTVDQQEVDFILYGPKSLVAIEVKSSKIVHPSDLRGLQLFKEEYPIAKLFLFYGGKEALYRNDIEILPIAELLPKLPQFLKKQSLNYTGSDSRIGL